MTPDELHIHLTALALGSLGYIDDALADVLCALIDIHHPSESRSINTLNCDEHNVTKVRNPVEDYRRDVFENCPDCIVTPITVCSSWSCGSYPCETIQAMADALQLGPVDAVTE